MKKLLLILATFAIIGISNAALVNNGGFDVNAADWNAAGGGGAWAPGHVATGGNPGGYLTLQAANQTWSVWYQVGTESLAAWGIPAGTTVTVQGDLIDLGTAGNNTLAGLKIESWSTANLGEGASTFTATNAWKSFSFDYTIHAEATAVKLITTNVNYNNLGVAKYGFDNIELLIAGGTPALKPIPAVGGTLPTVNDVLSWTNPDPNDPADTVTADVFILQSNTPLTDPNLGPAMVEPGCVQVANDITAESLDLSDAGYNLMADKYYYWAVHVTDDGKVVKGFDWHFLSSGDAPPANISAGADQYVWLVNGTRQFTLTGTYTDDNESPITIQWADISNPLEQAPGTTVTINNPNAATTTVNVNGDGWFLFSFTVSDQQGTGTDNVNVGVYVNACAAAKADPTDIAAKYPAGHGDIDGDCDTDLADFALLASSWIDCMSPKLGCL